MSAEGTAHAKAWAVPSALKPSLFCRESGRGRRPGSRSMSRLAILPYATAYTYPARTSTAVPVWESVLSRGENGLPRPLAGPRNDRRSILRRARLACRAGLKGRRRPLLPLLLRQILQGRADGGDDKGREGAVPPADGVFHRVDQIVGKTDGLICRRRWDRNFEFSHKITTQYIFSCI